MARHLSALFLVALTLLSGRLPAQEPSPAATNPTPRDQERWQAEHERLCALGGRTEAQLIVLGDGALADWQSVAEDTWNKHFVERGGVNLSIAEEGTQHLLWRIQNGALDGCEPKLVIIHSGILNLTSKSAAPDDIAAGLRAVVDAVRQKLPHANILVLGLLPGKHATDETLRLSAAETNRLASAIADWEQVHFLDVGGVLIANGEEADSLVGDNGQLTSEAVRGCATAMDFKIAELMGEPAKNRVELFDGRTLRGWKAGDEAGKPEGWQVVDGKLTIVGPGTDAQTEELYGDFDFQCEWQVEERANSGIFYRWADYAGIVSAGPEYQVIDDLGRKLPPQLDSSTAATTDMYGPPADKPTRPAGQWNHTRIVAVEGQVENWLNGIRLYNFDMASRDWQRRLAKSKFRRLWPFGRIYEGAFRLQNYSGSPVAYRDLVVTRL